MQPDPIHSPSIPNLTRQKIATSIHDTLGFPKSQCYELLSGFLDLVTLSLAHEGQAKISRFGTLVVREKGERPGRNPKTGEVHMIHPRRTVTLKASQLLKDELNGTGSQS